MHLRITSDLSIDGARQATWSSCLYDVKIYARWSGAQRTENGIQGYANLEARRIGVQLASLLMYAVIALTVLLLAVRIGFGLANRLARAEIA